MKPELRDAAWYAVFGAEYSRIVGGEISKKGRRTRDTHDAVMLAVTLADVAQFELERFDRDRFESEEGA